VGEAGDLGWKHFGTKRRWRACVSSILRGRGLSHKDRWPVYPVLVNEFRVIGLPDEFPTVIFSGSAIEELIKVRRPEVDTRESLRVCFCFCFLLVYNVFLYSQKCGVSLSSIILLFFSCSHSLPLLCNIIRNDEESMRSSNAWG
jgi:hypothetical protein